MYLHKSKRKDSGRVYLTLMSSYRQDKKTKNKTIRSLGYADDLERELGCDPIAHYQALCDTENEKKKAERQSTSIEIHPKEKIDKRTSSRKNIGSAVLLCIYNAMNLEQLFRNTMRTSAAKFDLNAIVRLLVVERILNPGSKVAAWKNRVRYFFRTDFEEHDVYRALSILAHLRTKVISAINRYVDSLGIRDTTKVFYDVTNYYFEIDHPDDLRKTGVSKEKRRSPIVQMGLLQDRNAIPLAYKLFAGNTLDCQTMIDVLSGMKDDYKLDRVIVVADKGLNTANNIAACVGRKDGFIYSQSIRGTKSNCELRNWVISDAGYDVREGGDFKIKSRQDTKVITVEGDDNKMHKVSIECKVVAFWSRKYEARSRHKRDEVIDKARRLAAKRSAYSAFKEYGAAKYVREEAFNPKTGEVIEHATALIIDEEKIAAEEVCDGFYCIITSEYEMSDEDIIDTYRGLWRIEESFKVTKSDLKSRPVYVSNAEHIEAHFLTCYISLCILRILQHLTNNRYSPGALAEELGQMSGTNVDGNWWCFDHRSDLTDDVCATLGIDLTGKFMQLKDIKKILAQANRE